MTGFVLSVTGAVLSCESLMAQEQQMHDPLEQAARAASASDPQSVRVLSDLTVSAIPIGFHPNLSVSDRVFRAELGFRQTQRPGVSAVNVASALNDLCAAVRLPGTTTSARQVQAYRMLLMMAYPRLVGPLHRTHAGAPYMSFGPLQALFVASNLLHLKATEPSYQGDPDVWARGVESKSPKLGSATDSGSHSVSFTTVNDSAVVSAQYQRFLDSLERNTGDNLQAFNVFLSRIGVD